MTTTEDETNWLPFTVRRKPCCTSANVIVVGEKDPITGAGRALPQRRLSALQPGKNSKASRSALSGRKESLIRSIRHRTPRPPRMRKGKIRRSVLAPALSAVSSKSLGGAFTFQMAVEISPHVVTYH